MDALHRFTKPFHGLLQGDWRQPGTAADVGIPEPVAARGRAGSNGPSLHLSARRASLAQERARAREIVAVARSRITATFEDIRFGRKIDVEQLWPLVSSITASMSRHPAAILSVTRLKERHEYTYLHSIAVCGLMIGLARQLDLDRSTLHDIGLAGLLHDVGKARVPTTLLDKPGTLTADEFEIVRAHTEHGHDILSEAVGIPAVVLDVCRNHHERMNGSGYRSMKGDEITLPARMAAICDVYDAVTSPRLHKASWSPAVALEWLSGAKGQFDPAVLAAFTTMIGVFPPGSLVRLQSGRLAIVLDDPEGDPLAPSLCAFYCGDTRTPLAWRYIASGQDPILGLELPARWPLENFSEVRAAILQRFSTLSD